MSAFQKIAQGTIHLRRHQIDPYPPTVGRFLVLSIIKFDKFLTPPPLKHADALNAWSLNEFWVYSKETHKD